MPFTPPPSGAIGSSAKERPAPEDPRVAALVLQLTDRRSRSRNRLAWAQQELQKKASMFEN